MFVNFVSSALKIRGSNYLKPLEKLVFQFCFSFSFSQTDSILNLFEANDEIIFFKISFDIL